MSKIKDFRDKAKKELDEYFEKTSIENMEKYKTREEQIEFLESIEKIKVPNRIKEEEELYKSLTYSEWVEEIKFDPEYFMDLWDFILKESVLTDDEKSKLSYLTFELTGTVNEFTVSFLTSDQIKSNEKLRTKIIEGGHTKSINRIDNFGILSDEEKVTLIKNGFDGINIVLEESSFDEHEKYILLHLAQGYTFRHIDGWQEKLSSDAIALALISGTENPEFVYVNLKTAVNWKDYHTFIAIKNTPSIIGVITEIEDEFARIYASKRTANQRDYVIFELSKSHHNLPTILHSLFVGENAVVNFDTYHHAYRDMYSD